MTPTPHPVRPLLWLLRVVSSRDAANAAVGDMLEELRERRAAGLGVGRAALWINLQVAGAIGSAVLSGLPRGMRTSGLILRDAVRALRASPAYGIFIVLVLAIGITAGTITFSVVDAVMFRPLPLESPDELVTIAGSDENRTVRITPEVFWRVKEEATTLESTTTRSIGFGQTVTAGGTTSSRWPVTAATADVFRVLRLSPAIGRFWTADEEARGVSDVAVIGYRFWQEQFGGDPAVLGATIVEGAEPGRTTVYRVIGVLSADSDHPELEITLTPIWVPRAVPRTGDAVSPFGIGMLARMRPGVSPDQVADEVSRLAGAPDWRPEVRPLIDGYVDRVRHWLVLALGAAGLVLLIACVNAANLMLTRSAGRVHELAIRSSLGASRRQIAAVVLAEGLLLSGAATACALLCSLAGVRAARWAMTTLLLGVFRAATIEVNGRVLAAAAATAVLTGVMVALVPAWQTSRAPVSGLLKDAGAATTTGRRRWRSAFLVTQVATVVVLLVASWLFVASLVRVIGIDLGIDRHNLLAVSPRTGFSGPAVEAQRRLEALPGVTGVSVSLGASLPLIGAAYQGAWGTTTVSAGSDSNEVGREPELTVLDYRVTPNYFDVAGIRFLQGATWAAEAGPDSPTVVLDERAARQLFGDEMPLGRLVRADRPAGIFRVVGVVPHVYVRGPENAYHPAAYFPLRLDPTRDYANFFLRTSRPAADMVPVVMDALAPIAPPTVDEQYVYLADDALGRLTATRRFNAGLMASFGLIGVLIGAAGVYAVMASFVAQQTREIGVRLALGATPERIQRGVLRLAWRHLFVGMAIGLPAAWWLSRGFTALLFQVTPADVSVYAGVAGLLTLVGFLAAWVPARRAAGVDPIVSLRR